MSKLPYPTETKAQELLRDVAIAPSRQRGKMPPLTAEQKEALRQLVITLLPTARKLANVPEYTD